MKPRRNFRGRFKREEKHRLNERIKAPEVRLINEDGSLVGVMSSFSALSEARNKGLDLVEIHSKSNPPICKIMNYGKWKFETKKKEKQNKRKQNKVSVKEIQLRPRTGAGDIKIKLNKAKEFLKQGNKVKVNVRFFGREMAHKNLGFDLLQQVEKELSDFAFLEMPAKMEKRALFTILAPLGTGTKKQAPRPATIVEKKAVVEGPTQQASPAATTPLKEEKSSS